MSKGKRTCILIWLAVLILMLVLIYQGLLSPNTEKVPLEQMTQQEIIRTYQKELVERGFEEEQLPLFAKAELILILTHDGKVDSCQKEYDLYVAFDKQQNEDSGKQGELYVIPITEKEYELFSADEMNLSAEQKSYRKLQMGKIFQTSLKQGKVTSLKTGNAVTTLADEDNLSDTISGCTLYTELSSYTISEPGYVKRGFCYYFDWVEMSKLGSYFSDVIAIKHNGNEYGITALYQAGASIASQSKSDGTITVKDDYRPDAEIGSKEYGGVMLEFELAESKRTYGRMYAVFGNTTVGYEKREGNYNVMGRYGHGTASLSDMELESAFSSEDLSFSSVPGIMQSGQTCLLEEG